MAVSPTKMVYKGIADNNLADGEMKLQNGDPVPLDINRQVVI